MLGVSTNKVKAFALTPSSAFNRVKLNEQNFGLIMAADASGDSWLTSLTRLDRISEIDAGCAVEIGCPLYLELSFGMLGEPANLQGIVMNNSFVILGCSIHHLRCCPFIPIICGSFAN